MAVLKNHPMLLEYPVFEGCFFIFLYKIIVKELITIGNESEKTVNFWL